METRQKHPQSTAYVQKAEKALLLIPCHAKEKKTLYSSRQSGSGVQWTSNSGPHIVTGAVNMNKRFLGKAVISKQFLLKLEGAEQVCFL